MRNRYVSRRGAIHTQAQKSGKQCPPALPSDPRMHWTLELLPLPPCPELGTQPFSGILWTLLVLFLWYCYRVGSDPPVAGRSHPGKLKSSSVRSSRTPRSPGGSAGGARAGSQAGMSKASGTSGSPCITMELGEEEEEEDAEMGHRRGYLTPVLSHTLFPAQAPPASKKLYGALQEYAKRYSWAGMGRIHKGLRDQAQLSDRSSIQKPHLFYLPDVPSIPFYPRDAHRHDIEVLEANYPIILTEFQAVYQRGVDTKLGWTYVGPKGQAVFPLYNAGVCVVRNCRSCPHSYRTLLSLRTFIGSNSLGAAGFWILRPGAVLGGGYGPTNTRLRCHLGLQTPPQCELVVGGEPQCWSEGHCLLVDDSFLHTVSHNGGAEDGPRVIFSVDLWHPNIAAAERQALDYIFSPEK
ncbi:aspartate beta-hydroxylase domain-containing protein 2 isoform X1 [Brienomyrus brachyistius]|uniref:aspartate beta-hydroxylase domain-containing protein 2 isoform X1 n=2 Tax=Brienomyrus brachyistius TaxID=42636 RepID=UPI0020B1B637|nr:aspartate beta-hydroxylase domain-containing protein 2 isoform X1 [Brienomyrus brachyistius]